MDAATDWLNARYGPDTVSGIIQALRNVGYEEDDWLEELQIMATDGTLADIVDAHHRATGGGRATGAAEQSRGGADQGAAEQSRAHAEAAGSTRFMGAVEYGSGEGGESRPVTLLPVPAHGAPFPGGRQTVRHHSARTPPPPRAPECVGLLRSFGQATQPNTVFVLTTAGNYHGGSEEHGRARRARRCLSLSDYTSLLLFI